MWRKIIAVIFLILATVTSTPVDGKCQLVPGQDEDWRSITYLCVAVTYDHVKDISDQTDRIEFSVSKLQIPEKAFARFPLRTLSFYSCDMRYVDPKAFDGLIHLEQLTFWESAIRVLPASWFRDLHHLTHLSLKRTELVYIEPETFMKVPNLQYLNIVDNELNCLPEHSLTLLRQLKYLEIEKNPWACNCHTEIVKWMQNRQKYFRQKNTPVMKFECMFEWYGTTNVTESRVIDLSSSIKHFDPDSKSQSLTASAGVSSVESCGGNALPILSKFGNNKESIRLSGVEISTISDFAFFRFGNSLRNLVLNNCSTSEIHSKAFAGLPKLERLVLFNNSINTVKTEWFRDLRGLKYLSLDRNGIKYIEPNVFPLLDKLETLSLEHNAIECLSTDTFGLMKNLKNLNIARNPWNCNCLNNFRAWLDKRSIRYSLSLGQCTNGRSETTGDRHASGYWNSSFEQSFTSETKKFHSQNFTETHETFEKFHGDFPKGSEYDYRPLAEATQSEAEYQRNKRSSSNTHDVTVNEQSQQRSRREPQRNIGRGCQTGYPERQQTNYICPPTCERVDLHLSRPSYDYKCTGGTILGLSDVPDVAESIKFESATIPVIPNNAFARFGSNLRSLQLWNCQIQVIEPYAFAGLVNLQELVLNGNNIPEIQAVWFESLGNLQRLVLTKNSIFTFKSAVFSSLQNLQQFVISDNQLNCMGIDLLNHMSHLNSMDISKNPWSCLCGKKLIEWMNQHNVNYNEDGLRKYLYWDCREPISTPRLTPSPIPPTTLPFTTPRPTRQPLYTQCKIISTSPIHYRCCLSQISNLNEIPNDAEKIEIMNSTSLHITADSFTRFWNLKELTFYNCSIRDIDPSAFRGLYKLKSLVFRSTNIMTIKSAWFHDLIGLTELDLAGNHIKEIEGDVFTYLPHLRILSLRDNDLRCIYTKSLDATKTLQRISLEGNPWKWQCVDELAQFLDARNITYEEFATPRPTGQPFNTHCKIISTSPTHYRCWISHISILDEIPNDAEKIEIMNSTSLHITADSFTRFWNLKELTFYNCTIRDIHPSAFRGLHKLKSLVFRNTNIMTIKSAWFHDLIGLTELDLAGNHITEIEGDVFTYLPHLRILSLRDNNLRCIYTKSLDSTKTLQRISLEGNPWKWQCVDELRQFLDARNITYKNFATSRPTGQLFNTQYKIISTSPTHYRCCISHISILDEIPNDAEKIEIMNSTLLHITADSFTRFWNLKELTFYNCTIRDIHPSAFRGLHNLKSLVFQNTNIMTIKSAWFHDLIGLTELDLTGNHIKEIEGDVFTYLPHLRILSLRDNDLRCIYTKSLDATKTLQQVSLEGNPWKWQCVDELAQFLDARNITYKNFATSRPTGQLFNTQYKIISTSPTHYRCWINHISILDEIPNDAEKIEIMNSTSLHITADSFTRFRNLKELTLNNCTIRDIDPSAFRGLHKLKLLVFRSTNIMIIKSAWFHDLIGLTELDLAGNHITEIEGDVFTYLPHLRILSLRDNDLRCIYTKSLDATKTLQQVSLEGNPWKWRCVDELTQFLDARNITYKDFSNINGKPITCKFRVERTPDKSDGATDISISTVNVLCVSIATLIFTQV